jgi:moderate conductance mechanosensitive channel
MKPLPYPPVALLQESSGEETTGVIEQVEDAAQETTQETGDRFQGIRDLFSDLVAYLNSPDFFANTIASAAVIVLAILFYKIAMRLIPRILRWRRPEEEALDAAALARVKRQDTAVTLARNILRYVVFAVVVLFVFSIFLREVLPAVAGASVLAAVIGFGAQSFLRDIIAGFSILFEGQYSVGDFIEVEPTKAAGIVEEFGLRTTKIRALSGELIFVPNGTLTGVRNYVSGQQRFTVEVQLSDPGAVGKVLDSLGEASNLYLTPPRLIEREQTDDRVRLRILAGVLPSMAWLVEENLTERIKAAAGEEALAAEPLIYKVDQANLSRIRNLIPEVGERKG